MLSNGGMRVEDVKVIANQMEFNQNNSATQFAAPLITTGNKAKVCMSHTEYFEKHQSRTNAILLGDNVEDRQMSVVVEEYSANVLSIGFLNDKVKERLELYMSTFDIVILNDPDFGDVIEILNAIN